MSFDPKRARDYIKTIDLHGTARSILAYDAATEDGEIFERGHTQFRVVGSAILSFAAGIAPEAREAISDSMLLAQLVANKQTPAGAPVAWLKATAEMLENLGWSFENGAWDDHTNRGKAALVHDRIIEVMSGVFGPEAAALESVRSTVESLDDMEPNDACLAIFNREARKGKIAHFQVAHLEKQMNGDVYGTMLACAVDAETTMGQVLFFNLIEGKAKFLASSRRLAINRTGLMELGPSIRAKVRPYQADYVSPILDL